MFQRVGKTAFKKTLETSLAFDKYFNFPHTKYKTIHIAGTNGKGSVAHSLASVLQEAGYKTGLYTSPHYKDYRERIKVNGKHVNKQFVIDFVEKNKEFISDLKPSFFEMTVAMAFQYFATENVDIAIIEVGLGGRLDSTNIISPILTIITNISLDHTQFLGNTIEEITAEKAGIIKNNTPIIYGGKNKIARNVIINKAKEKNCRYFEASQQFTAKQSSAPFKRVGTLTAHKQILDILKNDKIIHKNLNFDLLGKYQIHNIITVFQAIEILNDLELNITEKNIFSGLENIKKNTNILGRWQILQNKPLMICDSAHNEAGIIEITKQIKNINFNKLHFIIGVVNDKSLNNILKLLPKNATYYFTKANIPRALSELELQEIAKEHNLFGKSYPTVAKALNAAKQNAKQDDLIFISGSIFVVAEVVY